MFWSAGDVGGRVQRPVRAVRAVAARHGGAVTGVQVAPAAASAPMLFSQGLRMTWRGAWGDSGACGDGSAWKPGWLAAHRGLYRCNGACCGAARACL